MMNLNTTASAIGLGIMLGQGVAVSAMAAENATNQPNILLILADDLGYEDLGFQGSDHIPTPNIDWLASQSMRFTDAHVTASVCSPSRAGLMTGRYQQRFGHEGNVPPRPYGMDPAERTMADALRDCGYRTAAIGKWHLGDEAEHYPNARGFDMFWGLREGSRSYWYNPQGSDKPGDAHGIEHNGKQVSFEGHLTDRLADRAIEFIKADREKPYFVFLSFTAPHGPLQASPEDLKAIGSDDNYAGLVYGLDRNIGRVLDLIKANGDIDNTIIWFLSDNGGTVRQASNLPLGGKKGFKFEGGHRVPFLFYWKGKIPAGSEYHKMISSMDIFPTSVVAAGGSLEQARRLDGVDLMPYVKGEIKKVPHEKLFWRKLDCAAVRAGDWKLIRVNGYGNALYDLSKDLAEEHDLSKQMPEKTLQMQQLLEGWEQDKMSPIWDEGDYWRYHRYVYHTKKIKDGKNPTVKRSEVRKLMKQKVLEK